MLTRRQLIKRGAAGGVGLALSGSVGALAAPRPKTALTPFLDELPLPGAGWPVVDLRSAGAGASHALPLNQFAVQFHQQLASTTVLGYGPTSGRVTHLSPTVIVNKDQQVALTYAVSPAITAPLFAPDTNVHPSDHGGVPAVRFNTHLHGSHVEDIYDGNPYAHRVPGDPPAPPDQDPAAPLEITTNQGQTMQYVNDQEAGLLFYHDHGLGITRSNVYAAAAGAYVIVDPAHDLATPDDPVGIPLVIQDKLFAGSALSYPQGPNSWVPEFFGDVSLVNGKIWPFMNTQPRWYRFRLLNASNSRIYSLRLFPSDTDDPLPFEQIGNELGFLPTPVSVDPLVLAPAERADVLVDFRELAGQRVELRSMPLPKGTVNPATKLARSEVMQFRVATGNAGPDITPNLPNQPPVDPPVDAQVITHTLEEVVSALGTPLRALLDGKKFIDPLSPADKIQNGATVFWDIVNLTADTHPIHLHLVHFSVISRRKFDMRGYQAELDAQRPEWDPISHSGDNAWMSNNVADVTPFLGKAGKVDPNERGYRDTVRANPGEVTRIAAKFQVPAGAPTPSESSPARYVWHCHILEHEDNDMMRPYQVV